MNRMLILAAACCALALGGCSATGSQTGSAPRRIGRWLRRHRDQRRGIWVGDLNNDVVDRISPVSNSITASISVSGGPRHVVAFGGDLWVALFDAAMVVRLHPAEPGHS